MPTINQQFADLLNRGELLNQQQIEKVTRELKRLYQLSLKSIRGQISEMYAKYGNNVDYATMTTYNRLTTLEKQIADEIKSLTKNSQKLLTKSLSNGMEQSYGFVGFATETTFQVALGFANLPTKLVEASLINNLDRVTWIDRNKDNAEQLYKRIRQELTAGLIEGKGFAKTGRAIADRMNIGYSWGERIAWTEIHRIQEAGRKVGLTKTLKYAEDEGFKADEYWDATLDSKTRPNHGAMDGVASDENRKFTFTTSTGSVIQVDGPGLTGTTDDIRCRCGLNMRFDDIPVKVRRDNETGEKIPYKTYNEWYKGKYGKEPLQNIATGKRGAVKVPTNN